MTIENALGLVFPGQGSQSVGMLGDLSARFPVVADTFEEAGDALGEDLWAIVREGPAETLDRTDMTQPAMLAAGVAVWRVWREQGGRAPERMAGHSLGEYTALACAEALSFRDAVRLVRDRGRFMQEAVPRGEGAVAAVLGLDDARVGEVCVEAAEGQVVEAVNFNAPGQVVIAGHTEAVERALDAARAAGAKRAQRLPVSVPVHCALMRPAAERLEARLAEVPIGSLAIPVLHNVDVTYAADAEAVRDRLVRQLYSPVRWVETIQRLRAEGTERLVECGPGRVLAGLCRRIDRDLDALAVFDPDSLDKALRRVASHP